MSLINELSRVTQSRRIPGAHSGPVIATTSTRIGRQGPIAASAGEDGVVKLWDPATGSAHGRPMHGHKSWVRSLASFAVDEAADHLVSGGGDGQICIWNPEDQTLLLKIDTASSWVETLAVHVGDSGPPIVAAGGDPDGVIRCWHTTDGTLAGRFAGEHKGAVRALVFGQTSGGRDCLISGGEDGRIIVWDTGTFKPIARDGSSYPIWGLDYIKTRASRAVIVDGEGEGRVLRRDCETGQSFGSPLNSGRGRTRAIAAYVGLDSTPMIATGDGDGKLRIWNLETGLLVQENKVHTGPIWSLTAFQHNDDAVVVSGGDDGCVTITIHEPTTTGRSTRALTLVDGALSDDVLGREIMAAHLDGILAEASKPGADSAVVHLDGPWGSGKSALLDLTFHPEKSHITPEPERRLSNPILITYDAWRESSIAPEWWSLATAIHSAVKSQRTATTRSWMFVADLVHRLVHARPIAFTALILATLLTGSYFGWWPPFSSLASSLAVATSFTVLLIGAGRALFWSTPRFGGLRLRSDEQSPLDEISHLVSWLRRWSPRESMQCTAAEAALTLFLALVGYWLVSIELLTRGAARQRSIDSFLLSPYVAAAIGAAIGVRLAVDALASGSLAAWSVYGPSLPRSVGAKVTIALSAFACASLPCIVFAWDGGRFGSVIRRHPVQTALISAIAGILIYAVVSKMLAGRSRRPIVLVVDDVDRCAASRVVGLLEAIHTLIRTTPKPPLWGWTGAPAPLVIVVAGDGRWLRSAFEKEYDGFLATSTSLRSLGDDFMQKIFEHTVVVPQLSQDQARRFATAITDTSTESPSTGVSFALDRTQQDIATAAPGDLYSPRIDAEIAALPEESARIIAAAARASRATETPVVSELGQHLVVTYADLLPRNPRMIKRVVNAWGMLRSLKDHVGHDESDETLVRAAILMVGYPGLIRDLLSDQNVIFNESYGSFRRRRDSSDGPTHGLEVDRVVGEIAMGSLCACFGRILA